MASVEASLDPRTVATLREWRKAQLEERMAWGSAWTDSGYVFTNEDGSPIYPDRLSKVFRPTGRLLGAAEDQAARLAPQLRLGLPD